MANINSKKNNYLLILICSFAFLRPIFSLSIFYEISVFGINLLEIFALSTSYIFLALFLFYIIKVKYDSTFIVIIFIVLYYILSLLWGSTLKEVIKLILPLFIFFVVRLSVRDLNDGKILLLSLLAGFLIPVVGSFVLILLGKSLGMTIYWTGLQRFSGLYLKIHTFAHSMFIYIVGVLLYYNLGGNNLKSKKLDIIIFITLFFSIVNLYLTYTRTVYIGASVVILLFLYSKRYYKTILLGMVAFIIVGITSDELKTIFFDVYEPLVGDSEIGKMGSGRIGVWSETLNIFYGFSTPMKVLGSGLGATVNGVRYDIATSHNDYLSILITTGFVGLFLFLSLNLTIFVEILISRLNITLKFIGLGLIIATSIMNILSNSYLSRFEMAQCLYFMLGIIYACIDVAFRDEGEKIRSERL